MKRGLLSATVLTFILANCASSIGCEVRLKHPLKYSCPAVAYSFEDCDDTGWGSRNQKLTVPATIHQMSGVSFYCPSHEFCVDVKDLSIDGCTFTVIPRDADEPPEYLGDIFVDDQILKR